MIDFRLTYSFTHHFFFVSPLCSSITPSLFHFRLKLKTYTCFANPPLVVSLLPPDCLHGLSPGPFLLSYSVFVFSFSYFSFLVLCARLSWPSHQLLSVRYNTVSYRITQFYLPSISLFISRPHSVTVLCQYKIILLCNRGIVCKQLASESLNESRVSGSPSATM